MRDDESNHALYIHVANRNLYVKQNAGRKNFSFHAIFWGCFAAEDLTKVRDSAPVITVQMHDVTVKIGEPATFDVQISGQPRPDVYWTKVRVLLLRLQSCIPYYNKVLSEWFEQLRLDSWFKWMLSPVT